jgi:hypothetical protein
MASTMNKQDHKVIFDAPLEGFYSCIPWTCIKDEYKKNWKVHGKQHKDTHTSLENACISFERISKTI